MRIDDGRQIKAARAILGMTAQELADAAGLSKTTVILLEGKKRIRRGGYLERPGYGVGRIEAAIEGLGVVCDMVEGQPSLRFATTAPPPKYRRRKPLPPQCLPRG